MPSSILPSRKAHIAEAQRNYSRYTNLVDSDPDLALNCLFWCALHLVQTHAIHANARAPLVEIPENHAERSDYLYHHVFSIIDAYGKLKDACQDARYNLVRFSSDEVRERHDLWFVRIRTVLEGRGIKF